MKASNTLIRDDTLTNAEFESAFRAWSNEMQRMLTGIDRSQARCEKLRAETRAIYTRMRGILDELAASR